jgi:hypothetical protein
MVNIEHAIPFVSRMSISLGKDSITGNEAFIDSTKHVNISGMSGMGNLSHLLASHCKPWRDSSNEERLNGENAYR